jgi:hypothetical protein
VAGFCEHGDEPSGSIKSRVQLPFVGCCVTVFQSETSYLLHAETSTAYVFSSCSLLGLCPACYESCYYQWLRLHSSKVLYVCFPETVRGTNIRDLERISCWWICLAYINASSRVFCGHLHLSNSHLCKGKCVPCNYLKLSLILYGKHISFCLYINIT